MKKYVLPIIGVSSILLVASFFLLPDANKTSVPDEAQLRFYNATFPNSNWKLGFTDRYEAHSLYEYVLLSETVENWSQLVTEQSIPLDENRLDEFISITEESFRKQCTEFEWEVLSKTKNSVVYTWTHNGCDGYPPTVEITKVVVLRGMLYRLAYDKYTTNKTDPDVLLWKNIVSNANLK
jgi:hypothetical protein